MRKKVIILIVIVIVGSYISFLSGQSLLENNLEYVPGEIIVKYADEVVGNGNEILTEKELKVYEYVEKPDAIEKIGESELYVLKFEGRDIADIIDDYQSIEEIEYAEPNYILNIFKIPNDENYSSQWHLPNIKSEEAWNLSEGNKQSIIAIIDTGVDWNHPDLAFNIWNNSDEFCDANVDNDNNSYKGDCRGYDFVDVHSGCSDTDCDDEDNNPMDYDGHGTHTAGIAAAISNNGIGVSGICWNCSIMAVRGGYEDNNGNGVLTVIDTIQALHYAADNNATIISMSFGGSHSTSLQEAIDYASNTSAILVASSGNSGTNSKIFPCAYNNVICVAATDENNSAASYSDYGNWVDVAAPGNSIFSTVFDDSYTSFSGTSMSAPVVAGAIGLIKSLFPEKNYTDIKNSLNKTGTTVNFSNSVISKINIFSAILSLDSIKPVISLISPVDNAVNASVSQILVCNATDWQLKNMSLHIWNSSSLYYKETKNISGIINETVFFVDMSNGNYQWNCRVSDNEHNTAYASRNFSLFIWNISVNLISPLNNTYTNSKEQFFNCSAETEPAKSLTNLTFSLWNASDIVSRVSKDISGASNSSYFNYNFSSEGLYHWNCKAYNNAGEFDNNDNNFTFIYDVSSPEISLLEPEDNKTYTASSQTVLFRFNVSDNFISNCSLFVNNVMNKTNNSVLNNQVHDFAVDFSPGNYGWFVQCSDKAGNYRNSSSRDFIITAPVSSDDSSSGSSESSESSSSESGSSASTSSDSSGGGGTSINVAVQPTKTYVISSEQIVNGYTQSFLKNDKVTFSFNKISHNLIINEIGDDFIVVIVNGNDIIIEKSETMRVNLNNDEFNDLSITFNKIQAQKAEITLKEIHELIQPSTNPGISGQAVVDTENSDSETIENALLVAVLIIIIVILIILFYKHHAHATAQLSQEKENKKKRKRKK